jgi:hypothetical protein
MAPRLGVPALAEVATKRAAAAPLGAGTTGTTAATTDVAAAGVHTRNTHFIECYAGHAHGLAAVAGLVDLEAGVAGEAASACAAGGSRIVRGGTGVVTGAAVGNIRRQVGLMTSPACASCLETALGATVM